MHELHRVCVRLLAEESSPIRDAEFVSIFHEWIRARALPDLVLIDVADYTHVPDGPGVLLVAHEVSIALGRPDGRLALVVQCRHAMSGEAIDAIASTVRHALRVADRLEAHPSLHGRLTFDRSACRVEANDRLHAPNTDAAAQTMESIVRAAAARVFRSSIESVRRVANDSRERLAVDVALGSAAEMT